MLRLPQSFVLRWAVLCGYALLVALGHGGWHLITGESCGVHGHSHGTHSHATSGEVVTCRHGHRHIHRADHTHGHAPTHPDPDRHAPHDSDHCAICAVFSAPQSLSSNYVLTLVEVRMERIEATSGTLVACQQTSWPNSRGPPASV